MSGSFKARLKRGSAVVLLLVPAGACLAGPVPAALQVSRIRHWTAPDHTRIVLDMSSESYYRVRVLAKPHRIVIDIPAGRFASRIKPREINDGVINRVRINRLRSGAQIVLDVPRRTGFRHFALKPYKNRPHRIVIDLEKALSNYEIEREKEKAQRIARSGDCIVIIDPGHGGSDPGARSRYGPREKDVVLQLSRLVANGINERKGFRAVLTRDGDYNVGLQRRIDIARSHGGNCFVSIHMNSSPNSGAGGSEVYFLSEKGATDKNAQAVAERENLMLRMGEQGREMTDDVQSIIFDFTRNDIMRKSSLLAGEIASCMRKNGDLVLRGVKQANFVVLRSIAMPSVLIEGMFLSNRRDAQLVRRKNFLRKLAISLAEGTIRFLERNPPSESKLASRRVVTHVVSRGETLWGIARRYNVTVNQLRALNGLDKSSKIHPGQKLSVHR